MRVAIVERRTIHKEGESTAKRLHTVAELLAIKGHAVSFYCLKWWEGLDREKIHKGIRYYAVSEDIEDVEWRFAAFRSMVRRPHSEEPMIRPYGSDTLNPLYVADDAEPVGAHEGAVAPGAKVVSFTVKDMYRRVLLLEDVD